MSIVLPIVFASVGTVLILYRAPVAAWFTERYEELHWDILIRACSRVQEQQHSGRRASSPSLSAPPSYSSISIGWLMAPDAIAILRALPIERPERTTPRGEVAPPTGQPVSLQLHTDRADQVAAPALFHPEAFRQHWR